MGRLLRFARLLLLTIFTVTVAPASGAVAAGSSAVHHEYAYDEVPSVTTWHDTWTSAGLVLAHALGPTIENASCRLRVTSGGRVTTSAEFVATNTPGGAKSPIIDPSELAGKTPAEIDALAKEKGLIPKGLDPSAGRGSYVDPVTGEQRILCHPDGCGGGHVHVNDPNGQRLDIKGKPVAPESPEAHLPGKFGK